MTSSTEIAVRPSRLPAAIRAMRPRQWVKNVLVATAPLAAGQLFDADGADRRRAGVRRLLPGQRRRSTWSTTSATSRRTGCIRGSGSGRSPPASSARRRPSLLAVVTGALGLALGFLRRHCRWASPWWSTSALQILYSAFLKHLPVVDLAVVASGFLLRAIAGGVADRHPAESVVPAGRGVRLVLHGRRQALLGDEGDRRRRRHPHVADPLLRVLPAVRLDARRGDGVDLLQPVGLREPRRRRRSASRGRRSRSRRSPSVCCSTRWRSTPGTPANRRSRAARSCAARNRSGLARGDLRGGVRMSDLPEVRRRESTSRARHPAFGARGAADDPAGSWSSCTAGAVQRAPMSHLASIDSVADAVSALRTLRRAAASSRADWAAATATRRRTPAALTLDLTGLNQHPAASTPRPSRRP